MKQVAGFRTNFDAREVDFVNIFNTGLYLGYNNGGTDRNATILDDQFINGSSSSNGLQLDTTSDSVVSNLIFENVADGIFTNGPNNNKISQNLKISNVTEDNVSENLIDHTNNAIIDNLTISYPSTVYTSAVNVYQSNNITFTLLSIHNIDGYFLGGLLAQVNSNVTMSNPMISGAKTAVESENSSTILIEGGIVGAGYNLRGSVGINSYSGNITLANTTVSNSSYCYSVGYSGIPAYLIVYTVNFESCGEGKVGASGYVILKNETSSPNSAFLKEVFLENNLPAGTRWSVTFDGQLLSTIGPEIIFDNITFGNYSWNTSAYSLSNATEYSGAPAEGKINVSLQSVQEITFGVSYQVLVTPLPANDGVTNGSGTRWFESGTTLDLLAVPEHGFHFSLWKTNSSGINLAQPFSPETQVVVNGSGEIIAIFESNLFNLSFSEMNLPIGTNWSVTLSTNTSENVISATSSEINFEGLPQNYYYWSTFIVPTSNSERYAPLNQSGGINVSTNANIIIPFSPQFQVSIETTTGQSFGSGWYFANSNVSFGLTNGAVNSSVGVRYVFSDWKCSGMSCYNGSMLSTKITVRGPINESATWSEQYFLDMIQGVGGIEFPSSEWFNSNSLVQLSVQPATNYTFVSWLGTGNGSSSSSNPEAYVTMTGPVSEMARFSSLTSQVSFQEIGLPTGVQWEVTMNGTSEPI